MSAASRLGVKRSACRAIVEKLPEGSGFDSSLRGERRPGMRMPGARRKASLRVRRSRNASDGENAGKNADSGDKRYLGIIFGKAFSPVKNAYHLHSPAAQPIGQILLCFGMGSHI